MIEISATDAARWFANLLDAVEHRGETFTIIRRGRAIARTERVHRGRGSDVKRLRRENPPDAAWSRDLDDVRRWCVGESG